MSEFANRLINLKAVQQGSNLPSAIFGTVGLMGANLDNRERIRVGMWPAISQDDPYVAMGLMTTLAFLLERWADIKVYRLFTPLDGKPADFTWSMEKSQFGVEDWELESLDDNVGIWGSLTKDDGKWMFTLELEVDFYDDEDSITFKAEAENIAGLVNALPKLAADLAEKVEGTGAVIGAYAETSADDDKLKNLLTNLFHWQNQLLLGLWGVSWEQEAIEKALAALIDSTKAINDNFSAWAVANAAAHAMLPGYQTINQDLWLLTLAQADQFMESEFSYLYLGDAIYRLGDVKRALELMEAGIQAHPDSAASWMMLAGMYFSGGRFIDALETFQKAIKRGAVNTRTYTRYAGFLDTADREDQVLNTYALINPDDYEEDLLLWEAVAALEEALKREPEHTGILQQQILMMSDLLDEKRLWPKFEKLLEIDKTGDFVRTVVDSLYSLEDMTPAIEALKRQITTTPDRADLHVSLAVAYINNDEGDLAVEALEQAEELTDDLDALTDIQRLMLIADDPEFETRLAEINAVIDSGIKISAEDADFLEEALETAPTLAEGYVLLGKIYNDWEETEDALDILLDGHEQLPENPEIILALAEILWESDQNVLAFDYLNKGLTANPTYVPLLALTGLYLFEDGQEENARAYLARAEAIAPRNPVLIRTRAEIAALISRSK